MGEWINVKDRKPTSGWAVFTRKGNDVGIGASMENGGWKNFSGHSMIPTHWQPIEFPAAQPQRVEIDRHERSKRVAETIREIESAAPATTETLEREITPMATVSNVDGRIFDLLSRAIAGHRLMADRCSCTRWIALNGMTSPTLQHVEHIIHELLPIIEREKAKERLEEYERVENDFLDKYGWEIVDRDAWKEHGADLRAAAQGDGK